MKFTCTKENISHSLNLVSSIAGKQVNLPILSNILIQANDSGVKLIATNLEISISVNLRAKVEKTGSFTVPAKTLTDFIHLLSEEQVELEKQDNEISIKCGKSATKIKGMDAEDYPVVPNFEEEHPFTIEVNSFKQALSQVVIACAKNEIRPELSGVSFNFFTNNFSGLVLAATDSYRLAEKKLSVLQGNDEIKVIVPARTIQEIIRLLTLSKDQQAENNVRLWVGENQIGLRYDNFEFSSRLVDGKYPDYTQIIPKEFKTEAVFPSTTMINKIKVASLFTTTGVNAVSFDLSPEQNNIGISSTSIQTGEHSSEIEAEVKGEENSILLNHRYVLDGLQNIESEEVEFKVNSGEAPCLFQGKGKDDYLYIVMPIRQ